MAKPTQNYAQYGRTPAERALLIALDRWSGHIKHEFGGHKWLVMSAANLQDDGMSYSDRTIRRVVKSLEKRGVIAIRVAPRPGNKGNPTPVYWLRFCRQNVLADPATMAGSMWPGCPDQSGQDGTPLYNDIELQETTLNSGAFAPGQEQETEMSKGTGELPEGVGTLSAQIKLPPKPPRKHLSKSALPLYDDFAVAYHAAFEIKAPAFMVKLTGPLKVTRTFLAQNNLGHAEFRALCLAAFQNWAEFLKWSDDTIPKHAQKKQPDPAFLHVYTPVMWSYWNMKASGAVKQPLGMEAHGVTPDDDHDDFAGFK